MNEQCIVNVATGCGTRYTNGTVRLLESLTAFPTRADTMVWLDKLPPSSPVHERHPYGFKCYAFLAAINAGHRLILWCDSSLYAVKDPQPIFDAIARDGYYFRENGWNCGQWMTDKSLKIMGITRDEAATMPDFTGCCMGIDAHNPTTMAWFNKWLHYATSGAFIGDWKNDRHQCSHDKRCLGHRHDQVIGSVLFNQMGFRFNTDDLFQYAPQNWPDCEEQLRSTVIFINRGC